MQRKKKMNKKSLEEIKVRLKVEKGEKLRSKVSVNSPEIAIELMREYLKEMDQEYCCVLNLDTKNSPISFSVVSIGDIDRSIVPIRSVFKSAILQNAKSIMLFHNHPSGIVEPSQDDCNITKRISTCGVMLGIPVLDHIIVGSISGEMFSFKKETNLLDNSSEVCERQFKEILDQEEKRLSVFQLVQEDQFKISNQHIFEEALELSFESEDRELNKKEIDCLKKALALTENLAERIELQNHYGTSTFEKSVGSIVEALEKQKKIMTI